MTPAATAPSTSGASATRMRGALVLAEFSERRLHGQDAAAEIHEDDRPGAARPAAHRLQHAGAVGTELVAGATAHRRDRHLEPATRETSSATPCASEAVDDDETDVSVLRHAGILQCRTPFDNEDS